MCFGNMTKTFCMLIRLLGFVSILMLVLQVLGGFVKFSKQIELTVVLGHQVLALTNEAMTLTSMMQKKKT